MKEALEKLLEYYEDFSVFKGEIDGMKDCGKEFVAPSSIHSNVTTFAYGKALSRRCVDISNGNAARVTVRLSKEDLSKRRFYGGQRDPIRKGVSNDDANGIRDRGEMVCRLFGR